MSNSVQDTGSPQLVDDLAVFLEEIGGNATLQLLLKPERFHSSVTH
jgi:hypothetical protein